MKIGDFDVAGKRVLVRGDLNVPMQDGRVTDATRIERLLPTLENLLSRRARVVLMSHLGRPRGRVVADLSLRPLVPVLEKALSGRRVRFAEDCIGPSARDAVAALGDGDIALLENLRFHAGEEANDSAFAAELAALADLYVDDAFSCAHRAHASNFAIAAILPSAAGLLMEAELDALAAALEDPERPVTAVVGGAKVSTKLSVLGHLIDKVDRLAVGGGMANTFLHALGVDVGRSLCEPDMADQARRILAQADELGCEFVLPADAVIATGLGDSVGHRVVPVAAIPPDYMMLDIGPASARALCESMAACKTVLWNGPLGAFEHPPFDAGTNEVAQAVARLTQAGRLRSIAGGGDTVAALSHAGVVDEFSYVSTAGGAFLEWLEGKELPGVAVLYRDS
ncbi:MAG: phosphoglycerate kinase [Alphaproteobacteria bacterium]|nr:phosphoglycerate kinase [Alphaproteobacteria bacterium]